VREAVPRRNAADTESETKTTLPNREALSETVSTNGPDREETVTDVSLQSGDKLGKYEIRKKLGEGGMGAVYLAFDPMIEREVAIKVLPPRVASQPKALDRFLTEARATGKLNHPNVIAIYDIAQEEGVYYIVMELVRGGSAAELIDSGDRIDWQRACQIAADASEGLAAAHAAGLVHRDIKPENLMLTDDGVVKVVDFGLAKVVDVTDRAQLGLTRAGQILGTPHYMSPEQFQGQAVDARSDVYGLGATLYHLLTGRPPFADATNVVTLLTAHMQKSPPDPAEADKAIPAAFGDIVRKAMAKDPEQRYRDAAGLAAALQEVLSSAEGSVPMVAAPTYRALKSAVVIEPSKMQAMMFERALKNAGASAVTICASAAEARSRCQSEPPDLLITAMELSDAKGIELIRVLREDPHQRDSVLVLNSSSPDVEQLVEAGKTGPMAVVSKTTKPNQLLRALHSCTFLDVPDPSAARQIDPMTLRIGFVCDAAKIPDPIATLARETNLLDVQVTTFDALAAGKQLSGTVDLIIASRTAGDAAQDARMYVDLLSRVKRGAKAAAAVQVAGQRITLRGVQCGDFTSISRCPLDKERLLRVIQLCRND
jgi:serine/threonine protein kinase